MKQLYQGKEAAECLHTLTCRKTMFTAVSGSRTVLYNATRKRIFTTLTRPCLNYNTLSSDFPLIENSGSRINVWNLVVPMPWNVEGSTGPLANSSRVLPMNSPSRVPWDGPSFLLALTLVLSELHWHAAGNAMPNRLRSPSPRSQGINSAQDPS